MPEPPIDTIQESMKYHVGESSLEGDPIRFTVNGGAPSRHGGSPSRHASESDDRGKAVVVAGDTDKELMNDASSSSSSSSTGADSQETYNSGGDSSSEHDGAADDTHVPEALPINEADAHSYRHNREPRLFEDTPEQANTSSGLGIHECVRLMAIPEESQHDEVMQEPEEMFMPSTSVVTFQVPGFSMRPAGGTVPYAEWQFVEDPDGVGLENLDIFVNP